MGSEDERDGPAASPRQQAYFERLRQGAEGAYDVARRARALRYDPAADVEVVLAEDLAARVEAQTEVPGLAKLVRRLTKELPSREIVALEAAKRIARGELETYPGKAQAIDKAVRAGLSILTEGVVVAPLEGIAEVRLGQNQDGSDYVDLYFAGPIRAAGGGAQAMSVLIADVVRRELDVGAYRPTEAEIERYREEIPSYKRAANLQYTPSVEEIDAIVRHCPVCINGEGTEKEEITGHRDLPRVDTNRLRGGACLVIAEGLCLKAPKLLKHVKNLELEGWGFLDRFARKKPETDVHEDDDEIPEIEASEKYIQDLIGGRPVFAHPSRRGGFRLRYGRAPTAGLAATAISPVTMHALEDFLAVGTQIKVERPGKGTIATPCDTLEGPTVLLDNGDLVRVDTLSAWKPVQGRVRQITDLGEILVPYGEFLENNQPLADASYVHEWWIQDLEAAAGPEAADAWRDKTPDYQASVDLSRRHRVPLHPDWTLLWHDLDDDEYETLRDAVLAHGTHEDDTLTLPDEPRIQEALIALNCLHTRRDGRLRLRLYGAPLVDGLGLRVDDGRVAAADLPPRQTEGRFPLVARVAAALGVIVKPRAPTRIGARMGRPEKADARKMNPPVHGLYPFGNAGGNQRKLVDALKANPYSSPVGRRRCLACGRESYRMRCLCGSGTEAKDEQPTDRKIALKDDVDAARHRLGLRRLPDVVKGVQGLISENKWPEPIEKGILRAQHEVYVFKDGTVRFDMTDAPLTHFTPKDVGTSVARMKELGYDTDARGQPLERGDQLVELKVQDVVISRAGGQYLLRAAQFVDDLLTKYYGIEAFYGANRVDDLVGHLVVGLAPHTSAGVLGRIVGFTSAQVGWAHPFFHAGKRRNCLVGDTEVYVQNPPSVRGVRLDALYRDMDAEERVVDEFGTRRKEPNTTMYVSSVNPTTGQPSRRRVSAVYRVPSPEHLLEIQTRGGRSVRCSPEHRVLVQRNGVLEKVPASALNEGDAVVTTYPQLHASTGGDIDLLEALPAAEADYAVRGTAAWLTTKVQELGGPAAAARELGVPKKSLDNYRRRDSVPLTVLHRILRACGVGIDDVPAEVRVGTLRTRHEIPRLIRISPDLLRLLGYYLAEGHARSARGNWYQVSIAATHPRIVEEIRLAFLRALRVDARYDGRAVTTSGRVLYDLFVHILGAGRNAHEKRVPAAVLALPPEQNRHLVSAYLAGDGSVEPGRLHVMCDSVSWRLLQDMGFLLGRHGIAYRIRRQLRPPGGRVREFLVRKGRPLRWTQSFRLSVRSEHAVTLYERVGIAHPDKMERRRESTTRVGTSRIQTTSAGLVLDPIRAIRHVATDDAWLYDLEVEGDHTYATEHGTVVSNCDGDEDAIMLLMDCFLNFSRGFVPDRRGGLMDLPLVLTTRLDPNEIDKEAHNVDCAWTYPRSFYEATERHAHPKEVLDSIDIVENRLGTPAQYEGFGVTHVGSSMHQGPVSSSYKTLGKMLDKMGAQLDLADRIRAVDAVDVADRVISTHLLPDLLGNLKAFTRQKVRCTKCNAKYRRVPLSGVCTNRSGPRDEACGNALTLTVHEKSVKKYLQIVQDLAQRYELPAYTRQRIQLAVRYMEDAFAPDKYLSPKLGEFSA